MTTLSDKNFIVRKMPILLFALILEEVNALTIKINEDKQVGSYLVIIEGISTCTILCSNMINLEQHLVMEANLSHTLNEITENFHVMITT